MSIVKRLFLKHFCTILLLYCSLFIKNKITLNIFSYTPTTYSQSIYVNLLANFDNPSANEKSKIPLFFYRFLTTLLTCIGTSWRLFETQQESCEASTFFYVIMVTWFRSLIYACIASCQTFSKLHADTHTYALRKNVAFKKLLNTTTQSLVRCHMVTNELARMYVCMTFYVENNKWTLNI